MKNLLFKSIGVRNLIGISLLLFSFNSSINAQQFLTTIDGWNAYVHLPEDYNNTSKNYPLILFVPGIGEIGTDASKLLVNGPGTFIAQGADMNFNVNGQTISPIIICIQPVDEWPNATLLNQKIDSIVARWRIDNSSINVTGLSMGGWSWENYADGYNSVFTNRIASMVAMSAPEPDNSISNMKLYALAGGKWWGFEGDQDYRKMDMIRDTMNQYVPGSARYYQYVGGHCCWNTWYDPTWHDTDGESIYTWMLKQKKGSLPVPNIPPVAVAGLDKVITLPVNFVTLSGTGTDPDGSITSYSWTKTSGPAAGDIMSSGSATTLVNNLTEGIYQFTFKVTDNNGAASSAIMQVTVNAAVNKPPVDNAGNDATIVLPANTVSLSGTASDADGTITSYTWTKVSGPSSGTIANPGVPSTTVTNLVQGTYKFAMIATDNMGAVAKDTMSIVVGKAQSETSSCGCDVTLPLMPDGGIYFTNNSNGISVKPGQKVCIGAGTYPYVWINGLVGTAAQPITLINCGGQVVSGTQGSPYAYNFINSRYFRFTGTGDASTFYGFKADGNNNGTPAGVSVRDSGSDYEVDHIECVKVSIGILAKINPADCAPQTWNNAWTIKNISFHDNYVHNTQGEGFYLGHTSPTEDIKDCSGNTITVEPVKIDGIKVYNNITDSTGWDGIQIASALNADVHNNVIKNYGTLNVESQQAGMILGGKSTGNIYNNSINTGTGAGLQVFGIGTIKIYNNILANVGFDGTSERQDAVVVDDRPSPNNEYTGLQVYVLNNTVSNPGRDCIHLYNSFSTMGKDNRVYNNLLVQPNATSPYDDYYVNWTPTLTVSSANNVRRASIAPAGFVNASSGNFHLLSTSPAIDSGQNVSSYGVTTDYDGLSRPRGNAYDAGAYEYNSGAAPPNQSPVAEAGSDIIITLPTSTATLSGSGTDADGTINAYLWAQVSGPSTATIAATSSASTSVNNLIKGVYKFSLTVTDNAGATGKDTVQVTVNAAANKAPTANAGSDIIVTLPVNSATLNGSGSDPDGTISSYLWTKISGPASWTIINSAAAVTTLTGLVQGIYKFELTVTDNSGAKGKDTVKVTVGAAVNQSPTANAGTNIIITLPTNTTTLSGNGTDPDGTIAGYSWTKISGSTATIVSPASANTVINSLVQGVYLFQLLVTDNNGATAKDTVQVTVNAAANKAPTSNAGTDITITFPTNTTTLNGSGTDDDGTIASYSWTKISGSTATIVSPSSATTVINSLVQGTYKFALTVTDNKGATGKDTVQVTVNAAANKAPIANAGTDITITLPTNTTTLRGSGTDADGTIASYSWTKISGSTATIVSPSSATTVINSLVQGTYKFALTVTDNKGATGKDTVQVTVNAAANKAPTSNAGTDITITLPTNTTTLRGSGTDADGTIASYSWTKISGSTATIVSPSSATTAVNSLVQGTYKFALTVTDNKGATGKDTIQVTVNAAANKAPIANAGTDITITLPTNTTTLRGSGTDADGTIASYSWTKISGSTATIVSPGSATTVINSLVQGTYKFALTVTDNKGATGKDTIQVTVNAAANKAPIANAGTDITITLPTNTTTLRGSGTDDDGTIASYSWTKISGSTATIVSPSSATTAVNSLVQGTYKFALTVTDNKGATGKDTIQVTVNAAANKAPIANAGTDITITLPTNTTTLRGSGTDADGTIASYSWTKISGSTATIVSPGSATTVINSLVQGTYKFALTVTDNKGATGKDTVQVTVNAAAKSGPVANAGNDVTITRPSSTANLNGSATDQTGTITTYKWSKISGPFSYSINNRNAAQTTVSRLKEGTYKFILTVTDNNGKVDSDTMEIIVQSNTQKQNVKANAGEDISLLYPVNHATLNGSGSSGNGTIVSYHWRKINGPFLYFIANRNDAKTSVNGLRNGIYKFELTVTDNNGFSGTDTMIVNVGKSVIELENNDSVINQQSFSNSTGFEKNDVKAYPNPLRDNLNLDISNKNRDDQLIISIVNIKGVTMYKQTVSGIKVMPSVTRQINISSFQQGMYIVNVKFGNTDQHQVNAKIIKGD